jgi:hypothetical protein
MADIVMVLRETEKNYSFRKEPKQKKEGFGSYMKRVLQL